MDKKIVFYGQTTFIDKPREIVINDFQNTYITGDGSENDKINSELKELVGLILGSKDLQKEDQEESVKALHVAAKQGSGEKASKRSLSDTIRNVQRVTDKAADIAVPALGIITTVLKLIGLR